MSNEIVAKLMQEYANKNKDEEKGKKERFDHFSMFGDPKNMLEIGAYTNAIKTYLNLLGIADVTEEDALKYAVGRFILETDDRVPDGVELRMRVKSLLQEEKQELKKPDYAEIIRDMEEGLKNTEIKPEDKAQVIAALKEKYQVQ